MRLSCLINNYNYGRFVAEAVESALSQSTPFDEVIVVDDGSNDHSLAVLASLEQRYPRLKVVRKSNGGQLSAFSAGLAASTGDVLYFLDADDLYEPDYVDCLAASNGSSALSRKKSTSVTPSRCWRRGVFGAGLRRLASR